MRRHRGGALVALTTVAGLLGAVAPASSASGAVGRGLPPPPACATAMAPMTGTTARKSSPLPAPASDAGGAQLARPGLQVSVPANVPRPPALRATAWIVADLTTGDVLASCNAHVPLAPASTLKILTAVALHSRIRPATRYLARPADAAVDGTKVGLSPGSVYTVDNLWHGLLMGSGNDAATAVATLAGGIPAAADLMTRTARSLGATDTVVANTSGLDAPGQVSSVYDLAIIGRALLRDRALAAVVQTKTYEFPAAGTALSPGRRRTYQIQNHDVLLFRYPGATGIKNGFTTAAGASFVGSATRAGHSYVVALLRTDYDSWRMAAELLDWAFASGRRAAPVGVLAPAQTGAVASGASNRSSAGGTFAGSGVTSAVAVPVHATLQAVPSGSRTAWLLAALVVALTGGAAVRRLAVRSARAGGGTRPPSRPTGRRPSKRSPR